MSETIKRPMGHHHGDLRTALEAAALELVAEKGAHGFSLSEASRRAGVSVAAPYKHFADREALLAALAWRGYVEQRRRFTEAIAAAATPVDKLAAFAGAYVRFAGDRRALFDITFSSGLEKSRYESIATAGDEVFAVVLAPAALLRIEAADAADLAFSVVASAHGYATLLLEGTFGAPETALAATIERAEAAARKLAA